MKEKPGVMLYFDRLPYLNRMTREQRGDLFLWIMEYGRYGVVPEIEDPMLGMAWDMVKPAIDHDTERYEAKCERNADNARKRWKKETDAIACERIPKTKTKQPHKHPHPQKHLQNEAAAELLRLAEARRREWEEERARLETE